MRLAVITAYFKEARSTLERCIESVRRQAFAVDHILVADGYPQAWIDASAVRHIALDRNHDDFGDTPRIVGLAFAIREGYDAVQFLDADNVVYPRHAEVAAATLRDTGAHVLVLRRHHLRPDGSILNYRSVHEETLARIDTNCYLFARPSFPTALKWCLIPPQLSYMGDRVFRSVLSKAGHPVAVAPEPTVGYTTWWAETYRAAGEEPPPGVRDLSARCAGAAAWWEGLDEQRRAEIEAALGVTISVTFP